jgi:hypothetical protein
VTGAGGMRIDTAQVRASAPGFRILGDHLGDILSNLTTRIEAEGDCWGSDSYGTQFVQGYAEPRDAVLEALPKLATGMRGIADGLVTMADSNDANETATTRAFTK